MNNIVTIKASSLSISTPISLPNALRWLRRSIVIIAIAANLALTLWATAGH
jgi:hypothetical protein